MKITYKQTEERLSRADAISILQTQDCTVTLNISVAIYTTDHNRIDIPNNLIYVYGINDYVHFHNIKALGNSPKGLIDIQWRSPKPRRKRKYDKDPK